jgi:hypothetical protein
MRGKRFGRDDEVTEEVQLVAASSTKLKLVQWDICSFLAGARLLKFMVIKEKMGCLTHPSGYHMSMFK